MSLDFTRMRAGAFQCGFEGVENGAPERIRTSDPQIRSLVLYPAELRARAVRPKLQTVAA